MPGPEPCNCILAILLKSAHLVGLPVWGSAVVLVSSQGFRYDSVTQLDSTKLDSSTFFSFRSTDEPRLFFAFALGSVKLIGACPILFLRRSKYLQITLQAILYDLPTSILHVCRKPGGCQSASPSGPVATAAAALSSPLGMYPTLELGSMRQWIDPLSFLFFLFLCLSGPISRSIHRHRHPFVGYLLLCERGTGQDTSSGKNNTHRVASGGNNGSSAWMMNAEMGESGRMCARTVDVCHLPRRLGKPPCRCNYRLP
ncbi:hypothetical protein BKA56DRAFT_566639 [Ilyonectria sp. MPI-CAGE-AT-0026]|nr:hypothetical protein BKA56DRAFT_566639 [Ilyonectria sp. MPI-CAGE-AT-0026]